MGHGQLLPEQEEELHLMRCWNKKTLGIVAVGALAVLAFAPSAFGRALPFLLMAACPLGMLFMARGAAGACRSGNERPGTREGAAPAAAEAEIARLHQEVERLRAGEGTKPTPLAPPTPRPEISGGGKP
jgi:hypothetical protein